MTRNDTSSAAPTDRRSFLSSVTTALAGVGAAIAALPVVGFVLGPLLRPSPNEWRDVGPVSRFPIGSTVEVVFDEPSPRTWAGVSALTGSWLRRETTDTFVAFSVHCTHLGCPVRWLGEAKLFMCPCHGGVFYEDGRVAAGPPLEDLRRHPVRVRAGRVEVETTPLPIT